jgi:hypothetical protein
MSLLKESLERPLTKEDLTIVPYYPWDYKNDTFRNKATSFDVCFTAQDGYHVLKTCESKKEAQKYIDNFKGRS